MSAILDIPEVLQRISPISVGEYHRLDEFNPNGRRTELIRGIILEKRPKSPQHCAITHRLYDPLYEMFPPGFLVRQYEPLTFADSEPEPDLSIVKGRLKDYREHHPFTAELVVEIAVESPVLDRVNAVLYAEAGVTEYWIVVAGAQQVEAYREPSNGNYKAKLLFGIGDVIECAGVPGVRVPVADIFADVR
jgi:Uma2 family endonuclease